MFGVDEVLRRGMGVVRGAGSAVVRIARAAGGMAGGAAREVASVARSPAPKEGMDDQTLHRKVESIIFRAEDAPKATVDVNVVDGVVYLRGQVRHPEDINGLESATRAIPEVQGVENLLHLPKTPAPTRSDTPPAQRKSRRTAPHSANPRLRKERTPPAGG